MAISSVVYAVGMTKFFVVYAVGTTKFFEPFLVI